MKKILAILFTIICFSACTEQNLLSRIDSDIALYSKCTTKETFHKWLFEIGSEGTTIVENDVVYKIYRNLDWNMDNPLHILVNIPEGVAAYHQNVFMEEKVAEFREHFKTNPNVLNIYSGKEYVDNCGCIVIELKNERNFDNSDL